MLGNNQYPDYVEIEFQKYYNHVREKLVWPVVLPKYFSKNKLKKVYGAAYALCPFHQEKTASMRFHFAFEIFHCFGCGIGGNPFTFIAKMEGGVFEAMLFARKHFQIPLPFSRRQWRAIKNEMEMNKARGLNVYLDKISLKSLEASYELSDEEIEWIELQKFNFEISCIDPEEAFFDPRDDYYYRSEFSEENTNVQSNILEFQNQKMEAYVPVDFNNLLLKKLVFVRHGSYGHDFHLNDHGHKQMDVAAEKIGPLLQEHRSVLLIVSTTLRAVESAEDLKKHFNFDSCEESKLFSDNGWDIQAGIKVILERGKQHDMIVVVSHLEYCEYLPYDFMKKVFGLESPALSMGRGHVCLCDLEKKTLTKL